MGYDNTKKCRLLPLFLLGPAKEFYRTLPDETKNSFNALQDAFLAEFQTAAQSQYCADILYRRKQKPYEDSQTFATALSILARSAYSEQEMNQKGRESLVKNLFLTNCRPDLQGAFLYKVPETLKEAVQLASIYEQRRGALGIAASSSDEAEEASASGQGQQPVEHWATQLAEAFYELSEKMEEFLGNFGGSKSQ